MSHFYYTTITCTTHLIFVHKRRAAKEMCNLVIMVMSFKYWNCGVKRLLIVSNAAVKVACLPNCDPKNIFSLHMALTMTESVALACSTVLYSGFSMFLCL